MRYADIESVKGSIAAVGEDPGWVPEQRLAAAVLCKALFDCGAGGRHLPAGKRHELERWFGRESQRPLSLRWILTVLDVEAGAAEVLRQALEGCKTLGEGDG